MKQAVQQPEIHLFSVSFADGSRFTLPSGWEAVFVSSFGSDPVAYSVVATRLRFVVGKYVEQRAWPSKFDGISLDDEITDDSKTVSLQCVQLRVLMGASCALKTGQPVTARLPHPLEQQLL